MTEYDDCMKCGTEIPTKKRICPECNYMGKGPWPTSVKLFAAGCILSVLIITAPIGIPLMLIGLVGMMTTFRWHTRPTEVEHVH